MIAPKNPTNPKKRNDARQLCLTVYTRVLVLNHPDQRPVGAQVPPYPSTRSFFQQKSGWEVGC